MEVVADDVVHAGEDAHQFAGDEVEGAVHDPGDAGSGGALGYENEVGGVVACKGLEEVELDGGLERVDDAHLHAAFADFAVALPLVDRADAVGRARESRLHCRIHLGPRRPFIPVVEVVDERGYFVRRCVDGDGSFDDEGGRFHRGDDENGGDGYDGKAADQFEHQSSPLGVPGRAYTSHLTKPMAEEGLCRELRVWRTQRQQEASYCGKEGCDDAGERDY